MAAIRVTGHAASAKPIRLLTKVVSSVPDDEGFTLPMEECKRSLELANSLAELCHQALPSYCSHVKWLFDKLNKLIDNAKSKDPGELMKKSDGAHIKSCIPYLNLSKHGRIFWTNTSWQRNPCYVSI